MKNFTPTPAMISAAETLFTAMAFAETIRLIVLKYKTEILAEGRWHIKSEFATRLKDEVILDPRRSYLMSDEDFAIYNTKCKIARDKANLKVDHDEQCPLLVAEELERQAKRALINAMADITKITADKLLNAGMVKYDHYVDLSLKLMAPFVRDAKQLMADTASGL